MIFRSLAMAAALGAMSLTGCDVDVKDPGRAPDMDVQVDPGRAPDLDVRGPEVDLKTREKEVTVPDVDIRTEQKKVTVPDLDVKLPSENDNEPQ